MTGYELVKISIFGEAWRVSRMLEKEPANKKLCGAWEALTSVMDKSALLDEFNEWRDKKWRELPKQPCESKTQDSKLKNVNWFSFLSGESQLECETLEDAKLLLQVCRDNNKDCRGIVAEEYEDEPYWYVRDGWSLEMTRYYCDDDRICDAWTVKDYVENHIRIELENGGKKDEEVC